jgi:hypothetical protein
VGKRVTASSRICNAPTEIFQDNEGVLKIMEYGRHPKHRTKHLNVRHFFARERIRNGEIILLHKPTKEMLADVMTKPVTGELFRNLISQIRGNAQSQQCKCMPHS